MARKPIWIGLWAVIACAPAESEPGPSAGDGSTGAASSGVLGTDDGDDGDDDGDTTHSDGAGSSGGVDPGSTGSTTRANTSSDDGASTGGEDESSTGTQLDGPQWALTELTYSDGAATESVELDDCTFCDATLADGLLLLRFQQAEGWTVWSVYIPEASVTGAQPVTADYSGAYVNVSENNPDLSGDFTGYYAPTTGSGTLTLTQADIAPGGSVSGTLSASLSLDGVTAQLDAEFYAEIPAG